ncbi:hypothetical protein E4U42_006266 [Claviceps africana]|uniref:Extracellular membrane protein CFEM domain-containing protein n=1 Tax=Claviceps africana TaxID=83212 RepID=A0A8K0J2K7_9HYPO|nr:hypothetical protein E4U42_006266 [Claviceps africana]
MGRFVPLLLSVIGTLHVIGVSGQSPYECIGRCTNDIRNKFSTLQCPDANAAPCFCKNPVFSRAILECSQSCGATMDMISGYLTSDFCKGQDVAKPGPAEAAGPSASPKPSSMAPASSTPPAAPVVSSSSAAEHTPSASSTPSPTSSQVDSASQTPSGTASSAPAEKTSHLSASTTSEKAASATSPAASAAGPPSTGLSQAAIAGIGIGVGAAALAIAAFIVCALMKGRKGNTGHDADKIDISKPMPGSGRTYTTREDQYRAGRDTSLEKYGRGDIEMTANRYEDMVPRTQPRTLV